MGTILPQTTDGQTISVAAGIHTGHVLVKRHDVTFRGAGVEATTIKADGTYPNLFQTANPPQTLDGQPVRSIVVENLTIDGDMVGTLVAVFSGSATTGPLAIVCRNVRIVNTHRNNVAALVATSAEFHDTDLIGSGGGFQASTGCTGFVIRNCSVRGGRFGFVCSEGTAGTIPGIDIDGLGVRHDYWASPTYEAVTGSRFTAQSASVTSHVTTHRRLYDSLRALTVVTTGEAGDALAGAEAWDRVEADNGTWSQVLAVTNGVAVLDDWRAAGSWNPVAAPVGTITVYRVALGRVMSWDAQTLSLVTAAGAPADAHWRTVTGGTAATPTAGARLDIIRHGAAGGPRDVDTGGVHVTKSGLNARLTNVHVRGGFSDMITTRAPGTRLDACSIDLGQDMGFTIEATSGAQSLIDCVATRAGFHGFFLLGGVSYLARCVASSNGIQAAHVAGWGVLASDVSSQGSFIDVSGSANFKGLTSGLVAPVLAVPDAEPRVAATATAERYEVVELVNGRYQVTIEQVDGVVQHAGSVNSVRTRSALDCHVDDAASISAVLPEGA